MTASIVITALLALFGGALVVAAFNAKHLIDWENRLLCSLADSVREYREGLEEEQRLLAPKPEAAQLHVIAGGSAARRHRHDSAA